MVSRALEKRPHALSYGDVDSTPSMVIASLPTKAIQKTGKPLKGFLHTHPIWKVEKVRALVADKHYSASFYCGGCRNFECFIDLFDDVFVLAVDLDTLNQRIANRPADEWGGQPIERKLIRQLHKTKEGLPKSAVSVNAKQPITNVVDIILRKIQLKS